MPALAHIRVKRVKLRYLTLKLRALCWVLRRLRAGRWRPKRSQMTPEKPTPRRRPWLVTPKVPPGGSSANLPGAMLRL
jgi:hypothetical protein